VLIDTSGEEAHTLRTMQQPIDMETALRVLKAILEKRDPAPADVDELRRRAPQSFNAPLDELARDVVQQAVNRCRASRAATAN
jgi:hypothetical protein